MKKTLFIIILVMSLILVSCSNPTKVDTPSTSSSPLQTPQISDSTNFPILPSDEPILSLEDLRGLIAKYKQENNYQALYDTAIILLDADLADTETYLVALDALVSLSKTNYEEINRLLILGTEKANDLRALVKWVKQNKPDYSVYVPFVSDYISTDEINTVGITTGNMTNAAKYNNDWWIGGLLTWQGDWVYLSQPNEEFALYKMRSDCSEYQRLGLENGSSLNIIGDWLYYINHNDNDKAYKIRTDGNMKTKLTDDSCSFMSVSGEWLFYHNGNDGGCLYKVKTDGSGKEKLVDAVTMLPCVYDGYVYYFIKSSNSSLYRISVEGGNPSIVIDSKLQSYSFKDEGGVLKSIDMTTDFVQTYCIWDNWLYFFDVNHPYNVRRVHLDGTGYELVLQTSAHITTINVAKDRLYYSYWENKGYSQDGFYIGEEIVDINLETLERQRHNYVDTEPMCTGKDGWVYYFKYGENFTWYGMSRDGSEHKIG